MKKRILGVALALASPFTLAVGSGLLADAAPATARNQYPRSCGADSYVNSRGHCVHRPVASRTVPEGVTAQCGDGTYSFSQSRRGTCSHHGGVSRWL